MSKIDVEIDAKEIRVTPGYHGMVTVNLEGVDDETLLDAIGKDTAMEYFDLADANGSDDE